MRVSQAHHGLSLLNQTYERLTLSLPSTLLAYDLRPGKTTIALDRKRRHIPCNSALQLIPMACSYLQERPCTRCIKRNIGHLCHDEPREQGKRPRSENDPSTGEDETSAKHEASPASGLSRSYEDQKTDQQPRQESRLSLGQGRAFLNRPADTPQLVQPSPVSGVQAHAVKNNNQQRWSLHTPTIRMETLADLC